VIVQGILEAKRIRKRIEQLQNYRRLGITTQAQAAAYEAEKRRREQDQQMRKQREGAAYLYDSAKPSNTTKDRTNRYIKRNRDTFEGGLGEEEDGSKFKASSSSGTGPPNLNIDEAPHAEQLSIKEKELCSNLRILPKHYLVIKDALLRESFARGLLYKSQARKMVSMDVHKVDKMYDFFVKCGWVTGAKRADGKDIRLTVGGGVEPSGKSGHSSSPMEVEVDDAEFKA